MSVDIKVPCGGGQSHVNVIMLRCEPHLTAQSACAFQPEGHVQHIVLLLLRGRQCVVHVLREDALAGRARTHT